MIRTWVAALLFAGIILPSAVHAGGLDGTKWRMRPKGVMGLIMPWKADKLKFADDQFTSTECLTYGFKPGPYESKKDGERILWSAVQTNDKGEKMEWQGTAAGNRMEGTFVWTKADGTKKTHRWKARKRAPKPKKAPTKDHPKTH